MIKSKIAEIFAALDKEGNGYITVDSFKSNFEAFLNTIPGSDPDSHVTEDSGFHCYSDNRHDDQASI
ncbi:hypothetical protein Ciccas_008659 [Cichlidogyrus casuarinus]|uniref:EF-hand domain-containing protein n=1 Tax=Cichlidogyrus casuarinus TaxID=1844966 RepID=A0ABD2Q0M7_9PLAT